MTRRLGAFLGVLALLLQMGVALAHDPLRLGAAVPWLGAPLCHVGGNGNTGQPSAPGKSAVCPLCLGLAGNACFITPQAVAGMAVAALPAPAPPLPPGTVPRRSARGDPVQPRGPPALV